ncbi:MAG: enoyl-CoA hydratase-related protein [Steroidobacteraceae bacterium]
MRVDASLSDGILLLGMHNPPVNCLSLGVRSELGHALDAACRDASVAGIVLYGTGRHFCAGGDLRELGTAAGAAEPRLSAHLLPAIERSTKPVVAAIHGAAIGGGFELALACHHRIALEDAVLALPELTHGLIPLSGSLRLPRLWGIARALPMMLDSSRLSAAEFRGSAVFDAVIEADPRGPLESHAALLAHAAQLARASAAAGRVERALVRNRPFPEADPRAAVADVLARRPGEPESAARTALLAAVQAGIDVQDFDAALALAQQIYDGLVRDRAV